METKDFNEIMAELKKLLTRYNNELKVTKNSDKAYELTIDKPVSLAGRKYDNLFFASCMLQKGHVGFYFFPVYTHPAAFPAIPDELKKTLKGKSCFNLKKWNDAIAAQVEDILQQGLELYKKEGLI